MAAKPASARKRREEPQDAAETVETLVKELLARASPGPRPPQTDELDDVLFDREIDGVRCVVSRKRKPAVETLPLSPREREVARMIAKGYPNKIIASVLEISVWTVSTHLRRIFAKLGVTSRTAMVTRMFKDGRLD